MKLATLPNFSAGSKRWVSFIIILVLNITYVSTSEVQNISVQVNSYLKTQVKETTVKGVILVAENMTDWFSQTDATTEAVKKIPVPTPVITPALRSKAVTGKPKCAVGTKPVKSAYVASLLP